MIDIDENLPVTSDPTKATKLPFDYFVLPLCLSFNTPFSVFGLVVGTIAAVTDPICRQLPETNLLSLISLVALSIGFIGMCYRQEWALWLAAILQTFWIVMLWMTLAEPGFRQDWLFLLIMSVYCSVIVFSCFYALWQCSRFKNSTPTSTSFG